MDIGDRIKEQLQGKGLKFKFVAEACNRTPETFSKYINGERTIPDEILNCLVTQFGVELSESEEVDENSRNDARRNQAGCVGSPELPVGIPDPVPADMDALGSHIVSYLEESEENQTHNNISSNEGELSMSSLPGSPGEGSPSICRGNAHMDGCGAEYEKINWDTPSSCPKCGASFID